MFVTIKYTMLKKKLTPYLPFILILLTGIAIRIIYLSYTDYQTRTHDVVGGHLAYIEFIAQKHKLPPAISCWECWQPPFYYIAASYVYNFALFFHANPFVFLQLFSLLLFTLFLCYGYLFITSFLPNKNTQYIAMLLLTFWPTGIMASIRIGNDIPYYLFFGAALYYLLQWTQTKQYLFLILSAFACFFCMITKSTALIPYSILTSTVCIELIINSKNRKNLLNQSIFIILILIVGFIIGFSNVIFHKMKMIASIDSLNSGLIVGKHIANFIYFDIKTYLTKPFLSVWIDQGEITGGRQYFWNYLLKSSLFGEFEYANPFQITLSYVISIFLLPIVYSLFFVIRLLKRPFLSSRFLILFSLIFPLAALISYRFKYPHSPNGDFRFILPILFPVCTFIGIILQYLEGKKMILLYYVVFFIIMTFIASTILLYIIPLFPNVFFQS